MVRSIVLAGHDATKPAHGATQPGQNSVTASERLVDRRLGVPEGMNQAICRRADSLIHVLHVTRQYASFAS
jgi:hypothetical protein